MRTSLLVIVALCICGSFAWSDEWEPMEKSNPDSQVQINIALKQKNLDKLEEIFYAVSTPGNPEYGNFRTMEEILDLVAPPKFEQNLVVAFLTKNGFNAQSFGDVIHAKGSVSSIEKLFNVEMHKFQHIEHGVFLDRAIDYPTIPVPLRHIVSFVTGIATFPAPRQGLKKISEADRAINDLWVVPQTVKEGYGIPDSNTDPIPGNSQAVVEFGTIAGVSMDDLAQFNQLTDGPSDASLDYTVGNFAFTPISPIDGESTLDVQYIMAVANNVPTSFWIVNGWMYDFTTLVQQRSLVGLPVPLVFSMSYGWSEADQCEITGHGTSCRQVGGGNDGYVEAVSAGFQKIGAMGITLLASSGDAGAASKENLNCSPFTSTPIQPNQPASSPYVTAVGGTMFQDGGVPLTDNVPPFCQEAGKTCAGGASVEIACSVPQALITSGGGFSNVLAMPSYQQQAVAAWLSSNATQPPSQYFNATGRAYPDVAGMAHKYMIVENGNSFSVDGTSASCPVTAGIVALINGNRLAAGQSPVGFINPALYTAPASAFNDITVGDNTHTESPHTCTTYGYGCSAGWDPVTGLGTPNYPAWNTYFMNL